MGKSIKTSNYTTGYKKPPRQHQFSKGKSGNPKGRPKGSKNFSTLLKEELDKTIIIQEHGRNKPVKKLEAIAKQLVLKALKGDARSLEFLVRNVGEEMQGELSHSTHLESDPHIVQNLMSRLNAQNKDSKEKEDT